MRCDHLVSGDSTVIDNVEILFIIPIQVQQNQPVRTLPQY